MFMVYAIYNRKNNKIYIGQTGNLRERMKMHNAHALGGYTSRFDGMWEIVYQEQCLTRIDALKRENQLKTYQSRQFVKRQIPE